MYSIIIILVYITIYRMKMFILACLKIMQVYVFTFYLKYIFNYCQDPKSVQRGMWANVIHHTQQHT